MAEGYSYLPSLQDRIDEKKRREEEERLAALRISTPQNPPLEGPTTKMPPFIPPGAPDYPEKPVVQENAGEIYRPEVDGLQPDAPIPEAPQELEPFDPMATADRVAAEKEAGTYVEPDDGSIDFDEFVEGRSEGIQRTKHATLGALAAIPQTALKAAVPTLRNTDLDISLGGINLSKFAEDQFAEADYHAKKQQALTPTGPIANFFTGALDSAIAMVPSMAIGIATKSPTLGLSVMGIDVGTKKFQEKISEGENEVSALGYALKDIAIEVGTEKMAGVFEGLVENSGIKGYATTLADEMVSEGFAEVLHILDEYYLEKGEQPAFWPSVGRVVKGALAGPLIAAGPAIPILFRKDETSPDAGADLPPLSGVSAGEQAAALSAKYDGKDTGRAVSVDEGRYLSQMKAQAPTTLSDAIGNLDSAGTLEQPTVILDQAGKPVLPDNIDDITAEHLQEPNTLNTDPVETADLSDPIEVPDIPDAPVDAGAPVEELQAPVVASTAPIFDTATPIGGQTTTPGAVEQAQPAGQSLPEIRTETPERVLTSGIGKNKAPSALENTMLERAIALKTTQVTGAQEGGDLIAEDRHQKDLDALFQEKLNRQERVIARAVVQPTPKPAPVASPAEPAAPAAAVPAKAEVPAPVAATAAKTPPSRASKKTGKVATKQGAAKAKPKATPTKKATAKKTSPKESDDVAPKEGETDAEPSTRATRAILGSGRFTFHTTSAANLPGIAKDGLRPGTNVGTSNGAQGIGDITLAFNKEDTAAIPKGHNPKEGLAGRGGAKPVAILFDTEAFLERPGFTSAELEDSIVALEQQIKDSTDDQYTDKEIEQFAVDLVVGTDAERADIASSIPRLGSKGIKAAKKISRMMDEQAKEHERSGSLDVPAINSGSLLKPYTDAFPGVPVHYITVDENGVARPSKKTSTPAPLAEKDVAPSVTKDKPSHGPLVGSAAGQSIVAAVRKALGSFGSRFVTVIDREHELAIKHPHYEGMFVPGEDGGAYVVLRQDTTPEKAIWTAWHELFHRGISALINTDSKAKGASGTIEHQRRTNEYKEILQRAGNNKTIAAVAAEKRRRFPKTYKHWSAIEEALAEIGALIKTRKDSKTTEQGDAIEGIAIPIAILRGKDSAFNRVYQSFKDFARRVINSGMTNQRDYMTDREVGDFLALVGTKLAGRIVPLEELPDATRISSFKMDREDSKYEDALDSVELAPKESEDAESDDPDPDAPEERLAKDTLERAALDADRALRGRSEPLPRKARESTAETQHAADIRLRERPSLGEELADDLRNNGNFAPTASDLAVMQLYRETIETRLTSLGDGAIDMARSLEAREKSGGAYDAIEAELARYEEAIAIGTSRAGHALQYTQRSILDDRSEAAMIRAARIRGRGVLTPQAQVQLKEQSAKILAARDAYRSLVREEEAAAQGDVINELVEQLGKEELVLRALHVARQELKGPDGRFRKLTQNEVRERTEQALAKWKTVAERMTKEIKEQTGLGTPNDITSIIGIMPKLINVGAYHIAQGAYDFTVWLEAMVKTLGKSLASRVSAMEMELIYKESLLTADEVAIANRTKTVEDLETALQASVLLDDPVSHSDVWNIAKAHRAAGVLGADAIMAATTITIQKFYPQVTERQVRRAFVRYGRISHPKPGQIAKDLAEARTIVRLTESINRLKEGKAPLKTGSQRHAPTENVRMLQKELREAMRKYENSYAHGVDGRLVGVNERREDTLRNRLTELETWERTGKKPDRPTTVETTPTVEQLRAMIVMAKIRLKEQGLINDHNSEEAQVARILHRTAKLRERIKNKDYARKTKKPRTGMSPAVSKAFFAWQQAESDFLFGQYTRDYQQKSRLGKATVVAARTVAVSRALRTSLDLSAFGRQSAVALAAHPSMMGIVLKQQLLAAMSAEKASAINHEILTSESGILAAAMGVFFNDPHSTNPSRQEEAYMDKIFQHSTMAKYSGIAASARAYNTGLNVVRHQYFNLLRNKLGSEAAPLSEKEMKHLAHWVNVATGRGNLSFGKNGATAGDSGAALLFFAPRWVMSRFALISLAPIYRAPSGRVRKQMLKEYLSAVSGLLILIGLVAGAFALGWPDDDIYIGTDPLSSDFMKIVMGNTRLDLTAGLSQSIVFLARFIMEAKTMANGETSALDGSGYENLGDLSWKFLISKAAPVPAALWNAHQGEDFLGNETDISREIVTMATPLSLGTLLTNPVHNFTIDMDAFYPEIFEDQGISKSLALQLFFFLGAGGGTFSEKGLSDADIAKIQKIGVYEYSQQLRDIN